MQSSARIGGAIVVAIGLLLFAWAFLWMKYSVRMQIRGQAIIRRIIGRPVVEDEWYFGFFGGSLVRNHVYRVDGSVVRDFRVGGIDIGRIVRAREGGEPLVSG
jgi:hypothetical protein